MTKICPYCIEKKNISEFYKNKNNIDGLCYECKQCNNLRSYIRLRKKTRSDGKKGNIPTLEARKLYAKRLKYCSYCKEIKKFEDYYKSKNQKHGIATICKKCSMEKAKIRTLSGKDKEKNNLRYQKSKDRQRDKKLQKKYGITLEEYKEMLVEQNSSCAICNLSIEQNKKDLAVDHNHTNGQVRELLCACCNAAIGFVKENSLTARKLADYIDKHNGGASSAI